MTWFGGRGYTVQAPNSRTSLDLLDAALIVVELTHVTVLSRCTTIELVAPQVCLQYLPSLLSALAGTTVHRSTRLTCEHESSRARARERERERERKPMITKTTEADLTKPRAYKIRGMPKSNRYVASGACRTFETREQRACYTQSHCGFGGGVMGQDVSLTKLCQSCSGGVCLIFIS